MISESSPLVLAPHPPSRRRGEVSRLLETYQARGKVFFSIQDVISVLQTSELAVQRQISRLGERVVRLPGRPQSYLIVPPEHRLNGAPPVSWWLDAYMRHRSQPYYLGLLSAADFYGSSQQAVQVIQVVTDRPTRPLVLGRIRIEFHVKSDVANTPVEQPKGMYAALAVSTPEATALDLIEYVTRIGGISRAADVIEGIVPSLSLPRLRAALNADTRRTAQQRLGYVLETLRCTRLSDEVARHLQHVGAVSAVLPVIVLQAGTPCDKCGPVVPPWNIVDNINLKASRT